MKKWFSTALALLFISSQSYGAIEDLQTVMEVPRPPNSISAAPSFSTSQFDINSATDDVVMIFTAPLSGEIEGVSFRTVTVTTGCTLDVRLETIDLATGNRSGSLADTNSNASQVVANTDDNVWFDVTFTASATVTKGDLLAIVLDVSSGTPSALQIAQFQDDYPGLPYQVENDGTPVQLFYGPVMALDYQTTGYVKTHGTWVMNAITTTTYNNTSTPDVFALKFQQPIKTRVTGAWFWADLDGDVTVKLYDDDGVTVLTSTTMDKDIALAVTSAHLYYVYFPTSVELEADTNYYLGLEPSSATNLSTFDYTAATGKESLMWAGSNFVVATAKDPTGTGSWTAVTTRQPFIGLLVDGIDIPAGSSTDLLGVMQ